MKTSTNKFGINSKGVKSNDNEQKQWPLVVQYVYWWIKWTSTERRAKNMQQSCEDTPTNKHTTIPFNLLTYKTFIYFIYMYMTYTIYC